MSNYILDHCERRAKRKHRHWGLHGRHAQDRILWDLNHGYRKIEYHYYYRDWDYFKNARRKWEALR